MGNDGNLYKEEEEEEDIAKEFSRYLKNIFHPDNNHNQEDIFKVIKDIVNEAMSEDLTKEFTS